MDFLHDHPESVPHSEDEWRPAGFALNHLEAFPDRGSKTRLTYADQEGEPADAWVDNMHEFAYPLGLARSFPNPPFQSALTVPPDPTEPSVSVAHFVTKPRYRTAPDPRSQALPVSLCGL
ncbi:hypothetical protein GCM10027605_66280 [Micromonospora zhanjiangensis]